MSSYVPQEPRRRYYVRMNDNEREQIKFIMERENIPDVAKTIRYCITEKYDELKKKKHG